MVAKIKQVVLLLEQFRACNLTYNRWTREQKDTTPKSVLEGAMFTVRQSSAEQRQLTDELPEYVREVTTRTVGEYFVHEDVDEGYLFHDLNRDFGFNDVMEPC